MYKFFLCLRYLRRRRIAFFAVAAVCLCTAMVLIVVSVMGGFLQMVKDRSRGMLGDLVMENQSLQGFPFYQEFIDEIKDAPELRDRIFEATPVIITYGVIRFPSPSDQITKPAQVVGIRLDETYRVNDFKKGLFYEKYYPNSTTLAERPTPCVGLDLHKGLVLPEDLEKAYQEWLSNAPEKEKAETPIDQTLPYQRPGYYRGAPEGETAPGWYDRALPGAILGTDLCARRQQTGDYERYYYRGYPVTLTLVPFTDTGKILDAGTGMPSKHFRYVDDCRTGVYDIDSMSVYVDFELLQDILEMSELELSEDAGGGIIPARTTQVQIKLNPGFDPVETRDLIQKRWDTFFQSRIDQIRTPGLLRRVLIMTWEEKQAKFIAAVEKEKYLVTTLFAVVSIVAVLLVGCIFYMIVQEKTRDIGIVRSVGATSFGVAQIFLAYGAAVGIVGGALGTVIGTLFVWYINEIQTFLGKIHPQAVVWNPEVYAFDTIPNEVIPSDAVVIYVIAIVASMFGAVIAAVRASRVWPVESLRYE